MGTPNTWAHTHHTQHMSQLSPEENDTPITWALSQIDSTQSRGERPGECHTTLQSSTIKSFNKGGKVSGYEVGMS
jgi:hypothetical protein